MQLDDVNDVAEARKVLLRMFGDSKGMAAKIVKGSRIGKIWKYTKIVHDRGVRCYLPCSFGEN